MPHISYLWAAPVLLTYFWIPLELSCAVEVVDCLLGRHSNEYSRTIGSRWGFKFRGFGCGSFHTWTNRCRCCLCAQWGFNDRSLIPSEFSSSSNPSLLTPASMTGTRWGLRSLMRVDSVPLRWQPTTSQILTAPPIVVRWTERASKHGRVHPACPHLAAQLPDNHRMLVGLCATAEFQKRQALQLQWDAETILRPPR
jgi:hypothetical protein